jgi:FkbM family methyltransferase
MLPIYEVTRVLPIEIDLTGRIGDPALNLLERVFPLRGIVDVRGEIKIDSSKKNERLLFYFFYNVLRCYRNSPLFRYMEGRLRKNDLFLDIGANLGIYSYLAKEMGYKVYLFEPEPNHFAFLKRNIHIFDRVFDVALSNDEGESDFYVGNDTHLTSSSLVMSNRGWKDSVYSHIIKVRTQRLDRIVIDTETISQIKLIKVDVEGAEQAVVEGMEDLLKRNRIDIWCEVRGEQSDRNPGSYKKVLSFLKPLGYQPYIYDGISVQRFSQKDIQQVFDILFVQETG